MKQGALIFDKESGRYNIRFGLNDYYGGLPTKRPLLSQSRRQG